MLVFMSFHADTGQNFAGAEPWIWSCVNVLSHALLQCFVDEQMGPGGDVEVDSQPGDLPQGESHR